MKPDDFFLRPKSIAHKQYEALRMFFVDKRPAAEVARSFGYTYRGFTTIASNFRKALGKSADAAGMFFLERKKGRKKDEKVLGAKDIVVQLRKKYYSIEDIKATLDSKGHSVSEKTIYNILSEEGFSRLPRRARSAKRQLEHPSIQAEKSAALGFGPEEFKSTSAGILCLLPYIHKYGIDKLIRDSAYPETSSLDRANSILSFVALKASNVRRYTADDLWCMDRGAGLFAGLNVLPKAAWFTSYSHRVTSDMNRGFLKSLHQKWLSEGLLGDTANLDFTTIPYWGDDGHLENNWSGKRGRALASMLAVLAHDPDSGIIDYGDANVKHGNENLVVLEFLDFYRQGTGADKGPKYLVFDSKFTVYQNLDKLNKKQVKFVTIRRRGKNIVQRIEGLPKSSWKTIRVESAGNKKRAVRVFEETAELKGYQDKIRQVVITGNGKIKPAIVITNDFDVPLDQLVRKYAKRWGVEKAISEQINFFHLNNVSSSMVIKVDFDLTMSILTHNIFRLFARDLDRYSHISDQSIYEKFLDNGADIKIAADNIEIKLKKKRNLPLLLQNMKEFEGNKYGWLKNLGLVFSGATYS
jgi:hypothetical protein